MDKKKLILLIIFFFGMAILLYPVISRFWNSKVQSETITDYKKMLTNIKKEDYSKIFSEFENYNQELLKLTFPLLQYEEINNYSNINNSKMIGYIVIDKIKIELPIYYGTSESVLNSSVGILEGSSLPIGTDSSHSILLAHNGLVSSKLFTDLNKLEIGDIFNVTVLDQKLTYQVDKITIIEPNDISSLEIIDNEDYVTLMTCTPYGINTHRLLVRGTRIENILKKELIITNEACLINKLVVSLVFSFLILVIIILILFVK